MWILVLCSTICTNYTVLLANKASENYIQPTQETRIETLNVYLKLQVVLGLVSEHVFLQLVILVSWLNI